MPETARSTSLQEAHAGEALGHVVPLPVLLGVFGALMVLTAVTVAVSYFDFGVLNLLVAIGVATVKAGLVAMFFMHLRYDRGFHSVVFLIGVIFLGLFLAITMLDSVQYQPNVQSYEESTR
jgi:cytochrome c oxidase subunit 4